MSAPSGVRARGARRGSARRCSACALRCGTTRTPADRSGPAPRSGVCAPCSKSRACWTSAKRSRVRARVGWEDAARARGGRRAGGGCALAPDRPRGRDDAPREARRHGRPRRDRAARPGAGARLGTRLRDQRQDDDDRDARPDPRGAARLQPLRREPAFGRRLDPACKPRRRARVVRGRRGCAAGRRRGSVTQGDRARKPLP